jgi:predicted short-subunit dehydrogenase-like oxidoreductase (DUF2520 family)
MTIGFIGAGATARALAGAFAAAGLPVVAVASRRPEQATALAARLPSAIAVTTSQAVVDRTDLVFLAVPDDAIAPVCEGLRWRASTNAVHCSGAHSLDVLAEARDGGAGTGSCHPLQTLTGAAGEAGRLAGCVFGIEADEPLRSTLREIVRRIGGEPLVLEAGDKPLYHAAAVLSSNYVVTLAAVAADLWSTFGLDRAHALRALLPLLRGTVDNLDEQGLPDALTGPIARGDITTVQRHLDALAAQQPETAALYRDLGRATVPLAGERRGPDDPALRALLEIL